MSVALIIIGAVVTAILLIIAIFRISGWITMRKTSEDLKTSRSDATEIHEVRWHG